MTRSTTKKNRRVAPFRKAPLLLMLVLLHVSSQAAAESAFGPTRGTVRRIDGPDPNRPRGDGVYGRFGGDVALQIGAGVEGDFRNPSFRPLALGSVSLYQTIGAYATYRESVAPADPWARVVSAGLIVSPLFLLRWPRSLETGSATWDLTVDSLALVGGVCFPEEDGAGFFGAPAAEFGLEMGVPLLRRANGLFLKARAQFTTSNEIAPAAFLWLSWQGFVNAGLLKVDQ